MTAVGAATRVALGVGGWQVQAPLLVHVVAGLAAIVAGYVALYATKGAPLHRRSGTVFVYAMLAMGLVGAAIAAYESKPGSVSGGLMAAYMVTTALLTVRPPTVASRRVEAGAMLLALALGASGVTSALAATARGVRTRNGVPVAVSLVMAGIVLACGLADARVLRAGGLRGRPRLVRHLWRMCFATFIATGSFFLGQQRVIPKPLRIQPVLITLAVLPLVVMVYWLVRVRTRRVTSAQRERDELRVVAAARGDDDVLDAGRSAVRDRVGVAAPRAELLLPEDAPVARA